jgi:hypothetical protein
MSSSEKSLLTPPPASPAKYDEPSDSENDESSDPSLFSKITLGKASVESVLSEWISEYETDAHDAMIVLINFLLTVSHNLIPRHAAFPKRSIEQ